MSIADTIDDKREKTVFWAHIISRPTAQPSIDLIMKKITEALAEKGIKGLSIARSEPKE